MTPVEKLKMIAIELRGFASRSHGKPATARITAATLRDYADELERVAGQSDLMMSALEKIAACEVHPYTMAQKTIARLKDSK